MRSLVLSSLLAVMLFSMSFVWAENLPLPSTIQVQVLSSYSHRANDGTTQVLGEVQNNMGSPINAVTIGITFMDDNNNQIEYKTGTTLLQVIPPGGKVPFAISSTKADPSITQTSVNLAGFRSASDRPLSLVVTPDVLQISEKLIVSGTITNNGVQKSTNTKLYLVSYDAFSRVVAVGTSDPIDIDSGKDSQFSITSDPNSKAKSYAIIAESDNYQSKPTPVNSIQLTLPIFVSNTTITDTNGTSYSSIPLNAVVKISSTTKYLLNSTQPYIYYVQVKQFDGKTDFIGKYEGVFLGSGDQNTSVTWTPDKAGSYFVETYVWNYDNVPLSPAAPSIHVVLVK